MRRATWGVPLIRFVPGTPEQTNQLCYNYHKALRIITKKERTMASSTTSIRLPQELLQALDALAGVTARNRNYLITEAVKEFVARETWHIRRIQESLRQADAGEFVADEEMETFWTSWTTSEALQEARAATRAGLAAEATT